MLNTELNNNKSEERYLEMLYDIDKRGALAIYRERGQLSTIATLLSYKQYYITQLNDSIQYKGSIDTGGWESFKPKKLIYRKTVFREGKYEMSGLDNMPVWELPMYFVNYLQMPHSMSEDPDNPIYPSFWYWSYCRVARLSSTEKINDCIAMTGSCTWDDLRAGMRRKRYKCKTIFVWGSDKQKRLSELIGTPVVVVDMQALIHGTSSPNPIEETSMADGQVIAIPINSQGGTNQPLFDNLRDDEILQFLYDDLRAGSVNDRDIIIKLLREYLSLDSMAMYQLYNHWVHCTGIQSGKYYNYDILYKHINDK